MTVSFPARTVTSLTLTVTGVSGTTANVGLAEIEVYDVPVGAPVASNACVTTPANTPVTGQLTATDPEGQPLTYALVTQAGKGAVNLDISGNFAYTPNNPNLRGLDKFTYQVTDTSGLTSIGSVWVVIDGAIRIMPVGDSITAGYPGFFITNDFWVSYRRKLYNDLSALNPALFGIDFVGTVTNLGASASPPLADRDNEGHSGWRDDEIANGTTDATRQQSCSSLYPLPDCNIAGWLNVSQPDVVLLHIGTNGINDGGGTSSADVATILDKIKTWETANGSPVTVMLARIIGSPDATTNTHVTTFNNNVTGMAQTRINNGDRIVIVNQQTGAGLTYQLGTADGSPSGPDMGDDLHPNQDGYEKMADKWKADLISSGTLPSCP
jgi:lysophospholipase L1-like esterase